MNISPISFAGTTNFQDIISRPQAYTATKPAASTSIKEEGKSHKGLKVAAGIIAVAGLVAGALVLGVNKGTFTKETSNKILKKINPYLQNAGTGIKTAYAAVKTRAQKICTTVSEKFSKIGHKAGEAAGEAAAEAAETIAQG